MGMILKRFSKISYFSKAFGMFSALWLEKHYHTKRKYDIVDVCFLLILGLHILALLWVTSQISISFNESEKLLNDFNALFVWINFLLSIIGKNDYVLRSSCIIIHCANMCLLYAIGRLYLKKPADSLLLVLLYALLPGVNLSAVLLHKSGFIIFVLLLICYIHLRYNSIPYVIIFTAGLFDIAFGVVFIGLGIYAFRHRKTKTLLGAIVGFGINMILEDINGVPKTYFLDTLGALAMLFSPLLFLYYVYAIYAAIIKKKEDNLMGYICVSGFVLTLLLSLRQEINMESFAPLFVIGLPILVLDLLGNIRVRLPIFRARFWARMVAIMLVLCLETLMIYGNKISYLFSPKPNFAYNYYIAKDLAKILTTQYNVRALKAQDEKMAQRLRFYGLDRGDEYCLYSDIKSAKKANSNVQTIEIKYANHVVSSYFLVKNYACSI